MIEKHYGRYIKSDVDEQLERILGRQGETFAAERETVEGRREKAAKSLGKVGGPTWTRTRDQPVMSRWL